MTLQIRQLLPADAAEYRELMLEGYLAHPEAFTASVAEREGQPLSWWEARTAQVLGAFAGGELVGAAGLERDGRDKTRHRAKLFAMYVGRKARRRGVGRALVLAVLEKARQIPGLEVVYLTVMEGNSPARRLYAACGFAEFGIEPMAVFEGGKYLAKVHMWHRLHPASPGCRPGEKTWTSS